MRMQLYQYVIVSMGGWNKFGRKKNDIAVEERKTIRIETNFDLIRVGADLKVPFGLPDQIFGSKT